MKHAPEGENVHPAVVSFESAVPAWENYNGQLLFIPLVLGEIT